MLITTTIGNTGGGTIVFGGGTGGTSGIPGGSGNGNGNGKSGKSGCTKGC